ncbi:HAD-IA family hydrolase [Rhizobium mongolense]|uniref:Phosphoglycolate phosphatase n=2 Tax=Rhizobium mongolense TaxID=57676 RepID=A0ABR6ILU5_9HYPH|nr:HAD-IA family hydrolase [Rhizobium mongolense]MBB4228529.1 phosphoglycolate phosphatase [Rhizobium mongolense]TVZ63868.1 phosphoglycolate phosphatase [Rhizobium mongolense USDA 1844]
MKLILFDCDGTLVDSAALIHEVMARTFVQFGHPRPDLSSIKSIIGLTLDIAIARMLGKLHVDDEAIAMTAHYKSIYMDVRQEPGMDVPLFAGIKPMIDRLAAREDILIGALTGKSRRGLVNVLETHGFMPHFIVSRTADDCPSKPHPAMVTECCDEAGMKAADAIVIGDAIYDMQMAKAAGAKAIGVSWGYASIGDLIAAGADTVAYHPNDVLDHF